MEIFLEMDVISDFSICYSLVIRLSLLLCQQIVKQRCHGNAVKIIVITVHFYLIVLFVFCLERLDIGLHLFWPRLDPMVAVMFSNFRRPN